MNMTIKGMLLALGLGAFPQAGYSVTTGEAFPDLKISSVQNEVLDPSKLAGKVTVINFWATWCEACKVELVEMQDEFAELLRHSDFQFVFVSLDKDPEKAKAWVKGHLKNADQYMKYLFKDPKFIAADQLGIDSFPMTLVVDQQGKVAKVQRGFKPGEGSTEELAQIARQLLKI